MCQSFCYNYTRMASLDPHQHFPSPSHRGVHWGGGQLSPLSKERSIAEQTDSRGCSFNHHSSFYVTIKIKKGCLLQKLEKNRKRAFLRGGGKGFIFKVETKSLWECGKIYIPLSAIYKQSDLGQANLWKPQLASPEVFPANGSANNT